MIRIALSAKAAYVFARIPGMPDPDVAIFDAETGNTVLIWNDDTRIKEINNARYAAASNKDFLLQLARESTTSGTIGEKMRRWEMWLRNGMLSAEEAGKLQ
jgi:hypothetical protein